MDEIAAAEFAAAGGIDPEAPRVALAELYAPVQVLSGNLDLQRLPRITAEFAASSPQSRLVFQPGAGHCPWHDDPSRFVSTVTAFLDSDL
jgi:proline iminopeptidase